jgi:dynein heavy chain
MNPKQRGVYSEILVTEDNEVLKEVSTVGPQDKNNVLVANKVQKIPRATGIRRRELLNTSSSLVDPKSKILGKSYFFRNPEVNTGYYSKRREGVSDVDPKVMEPYIPIKDHPPRKVVIDRQRKLFASLNIEELLLELGVDYSDVTPKTEEWLPLEPFDDTEYDCRNPQEWIACGRIDENTFEPIQGKSLWRDENGAGHWRKVLIYNYDDEKNIYEGIWEDSTKNKCEVSRINLLFDAEDPRIFAQRVAKAHRDRKFADSQIRYNLLALHMPTEDLQELDSEQISRIKNMAENKQAQSKEVSGKDGGKDQQNKLKMTDSLLAEINKNYARTMNKIILDKARENPEGKEIIEIDFTLPEPSDDLIYRSSLAEGPNRPFNKEVPYFGIIPIPAHDFPKKFSDFCFNSLYIKQEVFEAMVEIRATCNELSDPSKNIFDCKVNKTIRLEEFKQLQSAVNAQIKFATRDQWIKNITNIISESFANVGKGWFNIHETSKETYEFGKLKKFLTTVNFMMQDTVL